MQEQLDRRDVLLNIFKKAGALCHKCPHTSPRGQVPSGGGIQKADQMKISENFDLWEVEYSHTAVYLGIDNAAPHDVIANARKFASVGSYSPQG